MIMICIDMAKPWNMLDSLEHWRRTLVEHLHSLHISAKELNSMEANREYFSLLFVVLYSSINRRHKYLKKFYLTHCELKYHFTGLRKTWIVQSF